MTLPPRPATRMPAPASFAWPVVALAGLALAGCAGPMSHGDRAQLAACRARAEQVYTTQNRGDVYLQDGYVSGQRDTPFSGASGYAATSTALSGRYEREQMVQRCMQGYAGNVGSDPTAPEPLDPGQAQPAPRPESAPTHLPAPNPLAVPPKP